MRTHVMTLPLLIFLPGRFVAPVTTDYRFVVWGGGAHMKRFSLSTDHTRELVLEAR